MNFVQFRYKQISGMDVYVEHYMPVGVQLVLGSLITDAIFDQILWKVHFDEENCLHMNTSLLVYLLIHSSNENGDVIFPNYPKCLFPRW